MKKQEKDCTCAHCFLPVEEGKDGGMTPLHFALTGLPSKSVMLHKRCLIPYLNECESKRKPIDGKTIFQGGERSIG